VRPRGTGRVGVGVGVGVWGWVEVGAGEGAGCAGTQAIAIQETSTRRTAGRRTRTISALGWPFDDIEPS
jgi:hypothetical protein